MKNERLLGQQSLLESIKDIMLDARKQVASQVNHTLIAAYWHIGKTILEYENILQIDAVSSRQVILKLSKQLTMELGSGFSRSNLFNMRKFYLEFPDVQTVSGQLSWSHICELLIIEDVLKRGFYEKESINAMWSVHELKRQIDSRLVYKSKIIL
jgi:predicted nuclease of restriction endonuclease-like (RecB) superfamily